MLLSYFFHLCYLRGEWIKVVIVSIWQVQCTFYAVVTVNCLVHLQRCSTHKWSW